MECKRLSVFLATVVVAQPYLKNYRYIERWQPLVKRVK